MGLQVKRAPKDANGNDMAAQAWIEHRHTPVLSKVHERASRRRPDDCLDEAVRQVTVAAVANNLVRLILYKDKHQLVESTTTKSIESLFLILYPSLVHRKTKITTILFGP